MVRRLLLLTVVLSTVLLVGADAPRRACAQNADGKITCCCRVPSGMCCAEQDYGWCGPIVRGCICTG